MWSHIQDQLLSMFKSDPRIISLADDLERQVLGGFVSPGFAADLLLNDFFKNFRSAKSWFECCSYLYTVCQQQQLSFSAANPAMNPYVINWLSVLYLYWVFTNYLLNQRFMNGVIFSYLWAELVSALFWQVISLDELSAESSQLSVSGSPQFRYVQPLSLPTVAVILYMHVYVLNL